MTAPEAETLPEALKAMASAGFFGIGNGVWQIVALVVSLAIMVMGVAGGIEKANKVMMPVLFGLFLVLAVYIGTLPGASEGYKYILTLNPAGLAKPDLWVFAFGQAFFSLSVAGNGSVIYGSYLSKSEDIPSSARNVAVFDTIAALLAAIVIIPAMAVVLGEGISDVNGGPGLMFVYLVNRIQRNAGRPYHRRDLLHLRTVRRRILHRKPVRGTDRLPAGAVQVQACSSRWHHRCESVWSFPSQSSRGPLSGWTLFPFTSARSALLWPALCSSGYSARKRQLAAVNEGAKKPIGGWFFPLGKWVYVICAVAALILGVMYGGIG